MNVGHFGENTLNKIARGIEMLSSKRRLVCDTSNVSGVTNLVHTQYDLLQN